MTNKTAFAIAGAFITLGIVGLRILEKELKELENFEWPEMSDLGDFNAGIFDLNDFVDSKGRKWN